MVIISKLHTAWPYSEERNNSYNSPAGHVFRHMIPKRSSNHDEHRNNTRGMSDFELRLLSVSLD